MSPRHALPLLLVLTALAGGCQTSATTPGDLQAVSATSPRVRAGNAYLMRGWIGVFSTGINDLTGKIDEAGVRANVYQETQWKALARTLAREHADAPTAADGQEPVVLIGHSYGADNMIRVARELDAAGVEVALLITLDPVTPPAIPGNVRRAVNVYQPNGAWDVLPVLRGVPVAASADGQAVENWNLRDNRVDLLERMDGGVDHFNIEKKLVIHDEVIALVLEACQPRETLAVGGLGDTGE